MKKVMFLALLPVLLFAGLTEIKSISVSTAENYVEIKLGFSASPSNLHDFVLKNPARIVIDAEGVKYALGSNIFPVNQGDVLRVRGSQFKTEPLVARIVVDLRKMCKYDIVRGEDNVLIKVYTTPNTTGFHKTIKNTVSKEAPTKKSAMSKIKSTGRVVKKKSSAISVGNAIFYNSYGRRDPFKPITETSRSQDTLLDIAKAKLIGVMQDSTGYVALVEDKNGNGFILRRGDRIKRGRVVRVTKDMAVFAISDFGFTRTVILKLEKEEVSK